MPPNIIEPDNSSHPEIQQPITPVQPGAAGPSVPDSNAETGKKKRLKLTIPFAIIVILLAALGTVGYGYYQKSSTTKKFNDLAAKITTQENNGAKNYVKVAANLDNISQLISINGSGGATNTDKLDAQVSDLNSLVNQSCSDKTSDLTASAIASQTKGWKLNTAQKRYLSDWNQVISNLEASEYSNAGICKYGTVMVIFAKNFADFLPGLTVLDSLGSGGSLPNASQMKTLNEAANVQIVDGDQLKATMPKTAVFLTDLKTLIADLYYELDAIQKGDIATATKYDSEVTSLSSNLDQDYNSLDTELTALDKQANDAAIAASNAEISGIEYQKSNGGASNPDMQLDTTLPTFRIVEAEITNYSDAHNGSFPHANDINGLASIDSTVNGLKNKGYLKSFQYTSTGSDDSGFTLQATMSNGTVLKEKITPSSQSA